MRGIMVPGSEIDTGNSKSSNFVWHPEPKQRLHLDRATDDKQLGGMLGTPTSESFLISTEGQSPGFPRMFLRTVLDRS